MPRSLAGAVLTELLESGLDVRVRIAGRSMRPLLADGDVVTLRRVAPGRLRTGDLVLYRSRGGQPVLHRLLGRRTAPDGKRRLFTKGDSRTTWDEPWEESRCLGRVTAIRKDALPERWRTIDLQGLGWRAAGLLMAALQRAAATLDGKSRAPRG